MRVRNAHTSAIDGHKPGESFDVDPAHPAWVPLLKAGILVPASASDVRFGPDDPPPSTEAVRELVAGVNSRNREIDALHETLELLTTDRDTERAKGGSLQGRVNELEAVLALRPGGPADADTAALTARFDAAYGALQAKHDTLAAENGKLKADLDGLLSAAPSEPAKPAKKP